MWIHLHSLYAGILFLAVVAVCRFPLPIGLFCVPFCLAVDFGQFISRLQKGRQPWQFAFGSLLQSLALFGVFALASVTIGGSVHATMDSVAPKSGLVHMTEAADAINDSRRLGLPSDLYAGPASNTNRTGWSLTRRTGLDPGGDYRPIDIPAGAEGAFSRPIPKGPFTTWQYLTGQRYAGRGVIDLDTGVFTRTGINRTQAMWNAIDVGVLDPLIIGGGIYWYSTLGHGDNQ